MNEYYDVKGQVLKLEQRRPFTSKLEQDLPFISVLGNFDVEFSPSGQVIHVTTYAGAGAVHRSERLIYDEAGKRIRTIEFDGAGIMTSSTDFQYESEGSRVVWTDHDQSGTVRGRGVEEYVGKLRMSLAMFGANDLPVLRKTFEYAGNKLQKAVSKYYLPDGDLREQWISTYDSEGRMAETYGLNADGEPLGDGRYKFEYDREGHEIKTWYFNEWDNLAKGVTVFEYTFDELGNWIEQREYHRFKGHSHWTQRITNRKLTYYPPG